MALNKRIEQWHDKSIWIIGGSSGIGLSTAIALHKLRAKVAISARSAAALQATCERYKGMEAIPCDITDKNSVSSACEQFIHLHGVPDLVFICAGHYASAQAQNFDLSEMLRHNQVNYVGCLHVLDSVLPRLVERKAGHICLMGSVAGYRGLPKALAYGPTKAALINLADVLYFDLKPSGVSVSIINPGFVDTGLTRKNTFFMPALISPDNAASRIIAGWEKGRFEIHFPMRFTLVLKALKFLTDRCYFYLISRATRT